MERKPEQQKRDRRRLHSAQPRSMKQGKAANKSRIASVWPHGPLEDLALPGPTVPFECSHLQQCAITRPFLFRIRISIATPAGTVEPLAQPRACARLLARGPLCAGRVQSCAGG